MSAGQYGIKLNSVVFHTKNLDQVRYFYKEVLDLQIGTYEKNGIDIPDESPSYVNFKIGDTLLCFEVEGDRTDLGTVVLTVQKSDELKQKIRHSGAQIIKETSHFFMTLDPDGRELIIELIAQSN